MAAKDYAGFYIYNNINIIPIPIGAKHPFGKYAKYLEEKYEDPESIKSHNGNFFVICGKVSDNLHVLDIETWDIYERYFSDIESFKIKTPNGGVHIYYKFDDDIGRDESVNGWPVEIRAEKCGCVSAGSMVVGIEGNSYEVIRDLPISTDDLGKLAYDRLKKLSEDRDSDITGWKKEIDLSTLVEETVKKEQKLKGKYWKGVCPYHHDTNPSLAVYGDHYHCFGCGEHGDVIDWIQKRDNIGFVEAIEKLSKQFEVPMPKLRKTASTRMSFSRALEIVKDLTIKCKADQTYITKTEILEALAVIRKEKPIRFDIIIKPITENGIGKKSILIELDEIYQKWERESAKSETQKEELSPEIKRKSLQLLKDGSLVVARRELIGKKHFGDIPAIDLQTYCGMSTYLGDPLHADINGIPEIGKSDTMNQSLLLFPDEDVILYTEISAKHMYYESLNTSFENKIVYLDDVREEHLGLLKSMRNEPEITGRLGTVVDGKAVNIELSGHPVVLASSVLPLRDLGGQGTSRAFLIPIEKPPGFIEKQIRDKIRQKIERRGLNQILSSQDDSEEKLVIKEAERFLRDEGIKNISIPFDAEGPENSGRRDTGKFVKLIAVSAFMHQLQRPIMYIGGQKTVLAIQEDLFNALDIYHGLGMAHELRIPPNGLKILKILPDKEDCAIGIREIVHLTDLKERTASDNLGNLHSGELVNRKQIFAPGNPFVYWIDPELSERINAEISTAGRGQTDLSGFKRKMNPLKYGAKYSSDWLEPSIYSFFDELSGEKRDIRIEYNGSVIEKENVLLSYLEIFAAERENESVDSDKSSGRQSAESAEIPLDSDIENPLNETSRSPIYIDFGDGAWQPPEEVYA